MNSWKFFLIIALVQNTLSRPDDDDGDQSYGGLFEIDTEYDTSLFDTTTEAPKSTTTRTTKKATTKRATTKAPITESTTEDPGDEVSQ